MPEAVAALQAAQLHADDAAEGGPNDATVHGRLAKATCEQVNVVYGGGPTSGFLAPEVGAAPLLAACCRARAD